MIRRLLLSCFLLPGLAWARTDPKPAPAPPRPLTPSEMCEAAIVDAESGQKLPARILHAISIRESGRVDQTGRAHPWPWTINFEGTGHFFASKDEAIAAVRAIQAGGGQSVDVGCMQINLMHHAGAFQSLEDAFDPQANAAYAARFTKSLFGMMGDWGYAIAAYHSRTPGVGEPYRDGVVATWHPTDPAVLAKLTANPLPPMATPVSRDLFAFLPTVNGVLKPAPISIGPNMAYRAFIETGALLPSVAYRSFQPANSAYGDFSPKTPKKMTRTAGRPLDLRLDLGMTGGKGLVVPKAVIDPRSVKAEKPAVRRPGETG